MVSIGGLAAMNNQKGFALVYIALIIVVLMACLGLAVDVGHMQVVRGELQNSADAVARAGAYSLYRNPPNTPALDWERARLAAQGFIDKTKSDGVSLTDGAIQVGYWNLTWKPEDKHDLKPPTTDPATLTSDDVPAVMATISRSAGSNGGPVSTFFMKVLGWDNAPVSSRPAVAVSGFPGGVKPNILFPMALSNCMVDNLLKSPPEQWPNPITINSPYEAGGPACYSGQWTSFKLDANDVPTLKGLIENGNPDPLQIGDSIWIEPGAKDVMYQTKQWPIYPEFPPEGMDVVLAIVDTEQTDLKTKGERTITGFAAFHIDGAINGSEKYVYGHFIEFFDKYPPGTRPGGPPSNIVIPTVTVQ